MTDRVASLDELIEFILHRSRAGLDRFQEDENCAVIAEVLRTVLARPNITSYGANPPTPASPIPRIYSIGSRRWVRPCVSLIPIPRVFRFQGRSPRPDEEPRPWPTNSRNRSGRRFTAPRPPDWKRKSPVPAFKAGSSDSQAEPRWLPGNCGEAANPESRPSGPAPGDTELSIRSESRCPFCPHRPGRPA